MPFCAFGGTQSLMVFYHHSPYLIVYQQMYKITFQNDSIKRLICESLIPCTDKPYNWFMFGHENGSSNLYKNVLQFTTVNSHFFSVHW